MSGDENNTKMKKEMQTIAFEIMILTPTCAIYARCFKWSGKIAMLSIPSGIEINIKNAHALLGHNDEERTQTTAKVLWWSIT